MYIVTISIIEFLHMTRITPVDKFETKNLVLLKKYVAMFLNYFEHFVMIVE